ncbi:MAG: hypothetical protein EXS68_01455 [Candidatus Ryanbacteria bacterium]|nr:hypothetical protein [Candidatus Ryanbacteria bacterium]
MSRPILQKGFSAIAVILIITSVMLVMLASYTFLVLATQRKFANAVSAVRSIYIAEGGIEDGIWRLTQSTFLEGTSYALDAFAYGGSSLVIRKKPPNAAIYSEADLARSIRKLQVNLDDDSIFLFAALVGDGGLRMGSNAIVQCFTSSGGVCNGISAPSDRGRVHVNQNIYANGNGDGSAVGNGNNTNNKSNAIDAIIAGDAYVNNRVTVRPPEVNEAGNESHTYDYGRDVFGIGAGGEADAYWICFGGGGGSFPNVNCPYQSGAVNAISQRILLHEDAQDAFMASLRMGYDGSPPSLPTGIKFYIGELNSGITKPLKQVSFDVGTNLFLNYQNSASAPDKGPRWVNFNVPGAAADIDDQVAGSYVWLVLQKEGSGGDANNYLKIYFDKSIGHGGSWGATYGDPTVCMWGATQSNQWCTSNGVSTGSQQLQVCDTSPTDSTQGCAGLQAAFLQGDDPSNPEYDFQFRLYDLGTDLARYNNSLYVLGELHADEAQGATVSNDCSNALNNQCTSFAFIGRRFVSLFYRGENGNHSLGGKSIVQQFDNCDMTNSSGAETTGTDLETNRGFLPTCDSQVRDVPGFFASAGATTRRKYTASLDSTTDYGLLRAGATPIYTAPNGNPYACTVGTKYGVPAGGSCPANSQQFTPYQFNENAGSISTEPLRGCYIFDLGNSNSCGTWSSPSSQPALNQSCTYYIDDGTHQYGAGGLWQGGTGGSGALPNNSPAQPYNFCKYPSIYEANGGSWNVDAKFSSEALLMSFVQTYFSNNGSPGGAVTCPIADGSKPCIDSTKVNFANYLPRSPGPYQWPPITQARTNGYFSFVATGCYHTNGSAVITSNTTWPTALTGQTTPRSICVDGDLVIDGVQTKLNLLKDTHVYVNGRIKITAGGGGGIKMDVTNNNLTLRWGNGDAALVLSEGAIDVGPSSQLRGDAVKRNYIFVITRSTNKGDMQPFELSGSTVFDKTYPTNVGTQHKGNPAAIYTATDTRDEVLLYAPDGTVVLANTNASSPTRVMQVMAHGLIMRQETEIQYEYGLPEATIPGGAAFGVGSYAEIP